MRPLSQTLTDLITYSSNVITRSGMTLAGEGGGDLFANLAAEVRHAEARPAEGIRTTRAAVVMINALEGFRETGGERGSPWLMLAGTTLPMLRVEAWIAFNNEKAARGA